jgi:hypothetical protein
LKLLGYYQGTQSQETTFSVRGTGVCTSANGVAFGCNQTGDVTAKGSGDMGVAKLVWQPGEIVQYYAAVGVGSYDLHIPAGTLKGSAGIAGTLGVRGTIYPDTVVTPGIALDFSATRSVFSYDRFEQGTPTNTAVDNKLSLWTYQWAVEAGHQFEVNQQWKVEPYGGVKWIYIRSDLHELSSGNHSGGTQNTVTPFVGVRVPYGDKEALVLEGSQFVDGFQEAAGVEFKF